MDKSRICPCCGQHEFTERDSYELCPVCYWGDDPGQRENPEDSGGYNRCSLNEAREAWSKGLKINGPGSLCGDK